MGYSIYYTKKTDWWDDKPGFSLEEIKAIASTDEFYYTTSFSIPTPDGKMLTASGDFIGALYQGETYYLMFRDGNISFDYTDDGFIQWVAEQCRPLAGKMQGDEGELY
ncbi:hypothetical protein ACYSNR_05090 [Enterococcus sp. LJL128]|uniref:hypothetical protein n=1 Tax=Enterococcus sp. LJL51 TaxID=3416656 RepID=UPI003CEE53C4